MSMLPIPIDAALLVAGALLIVLALTVIVTWRRRVAADRARDDALEPWAGGVAWVADDRDDHPIPGEGEPSVWNSTVESRRREQAEPQWEELDESWDPEPDIAPPIEATLPVAAAPATMTATTTIPVQRTAGSGTVATQPVQVSSPELRDRLIAVLLADQDEAVRALDDLAACQQRLATLSESAEKENAVLDGIMGRLATTGLRPEQLAQLADLPVTEVRQRLTRSPAVAG